MRHRRTNRKFKREKAEREALLRGLARELILREEIKTTLTKAKSVRSFTEKLITLGKKNDRHTRSRLIAYLHDKSGVKILITKLAERFASREGGYTRIHRLGTRLGDGTEMAKLSLLKK